MRKLRYTQYNKTIHKRQTTVSNSAHRKSNAHTKFSAVYPAL